jgi:hypothetical protein
MNSGKLYYFYLLIIIFLTKYILSLIKHCSPITYIERHQKIYSAFKICTIDLCEHV